MVLAPSSLPADYVFISGTYEQWIIGPGVDLSGADLSGMDLSGVKTGSLVGTSPSSLPDGYEFVSGTNEQWIIGYGVNLDGLDVSGMNLSNIDFFNIKTGPLIGTAPTLSNEYTFVSGTNEQWIIGYGVDLSGADLSGANVSDVIFSDVNLNGVKTSSLIGSAPSSLPDGYDFVSGTSESCIIGPGVDLTGADLRGMDLSAVDLSNINLSGVKTDPLSETILSSIPSGYDYVSGTNENWIIEPNADLTGADLRGADLSNFDLSNINLSGVKTDPLSETILSSIPSGYDYVSGTNEQWIIEPNADLSGADLSGMDLSAVDLTNANLSGTKTGPLVGTAPTLPPGYEFVSGTNETWIIGPGVDLNGADLSGMDLSNIELSSIKTGPLVDSSPSSLPDDYKFIRGTNEQWIIGPYADLTGADLTGADLTDAELKSVNLSSAILYGAKTGSLYTKSYSDKPSSLPDGYTYNSYMNRAWIIGPYVDLSGTNLTGFDYTHSKPTPKSGPLIGTAPSSLNPRAGVFGSSPVNFLNPEPMSNGLLENMFDLSGADLSGMDLSDISFNGSYFNGAKTGPLVGTSPSFFSYGYTFVSGTNEQWIIGPDVNLDGADLRGMNLSNINLSGVNLSGAKTWPLNGSAPSSLPDGYDFISWRLSKMVLLDQVLI